VVSMNTTISRPVSNLDPFSDAFLHDPYPHHETLREAGPVVWLERYGIWAMARHQEVRDALTDYQTYCSSAGVGLSDFRKEPPWRPPSIILEADPPLHTRTRAVLTRILSPAAIKVLRETFEREAELLVARLVEQREFDGIADLAEAYPLKVFPDAVGLSEEGRENLLPYGSMVFNSFGPRNDLFNQAMANAGPVRDWIMSKCNRAALAPGGLGMQIFGAVDAGELHPAGRRGQRLNRKSIALSKSIDRRAGHADPFREIINFDHRRQLVRKPGGVLAFCLAQDRARHHTTSPVADRSTAGSRVLAENTTSASKRSSCAS